MSFIFYLLFLGNLGSPTSQQPTTQPPSQAAFMAANPFMAQGQNQFQGKSHTCFILMVLFKWLENSVIKIEKAK